MASRQAMTAGGDEVRLLMADPFALYGFIPDRDRNGLKEVNIKQGTGEPVMKIRASDRDSALQKVFEDKEDGIWGAPHTYAFFDTRVVRRTNSLLADLCGAPYGRNFRFSEYVYVAPDTVGSGRDLSSILGQTAAGSGGGVAGEKAALEKAGKYYKQGEGPALEDLSDAWLAWFCKVESENGYKSRNCMNGSDAYFETARASVESCMALVFDYDKLPVKGGCVTCATFGGEHVTRRIIASGIKFRQGEWFKTDELGPVSMNA